MNTKSLREIAAALIDIADSVDAGSRNHEYALWDLTEERDLLTAFIASEETV